MVVEPMHVVYMLVVMYALCYQLQSPLEPFLVEQLSAKDVDGAAAYARLQSFFSVVQMLGSFIVGYLLDVVGLRFMFALNFIGCAASYALLARATTMEGLYLSKLPAVLMAGFLCAQTAAAKLTPAGAERATALGRLTSSYTVGGVIGPALGGVLGVQSSARLAVIGSLVAVCLVTLLPSAVEEKAAHQADSVSTSEACTSAPAASKAKAATPTTLKKTAKDGSAVAASEADAAGGDGQAPSLSVLVYSVLLLTWPLVLTKFSSGVVNSSMGAVRPLLLKNEFHLDAARLGAFMSASFFGSAVVGLRLGAITERLGGQLPTIIRCLAVMALGYAIMAMAFEPSILGGIGREYTPQRGVWLYASLSLALALAQFPLATTITSLTTSSVPANLKGLQVGLEHMLFALGSLIGPGVGVIVLEAYGLSGCAAAAAAAFAALWLSWRRNGRERSLAAAAELGAPLLPERGARREAAVWADAGMESSGDSDGGRTGSALASGARLSQRRSKSPRPSSTRPRAT